MVNIKIYGKTAYRAKDGEKLVRDAIRATVDEFFPTLQVAVDVKMVSAEEIQEINMGARGVDSVTDVLSFPMLTMKNGRYDGDIKKERDMDTGAVFFGDIVICYDRVKSQAVEFGHSESRECAYLSIHSALHLMGFDHEDEGVEKKIMRGAEEKILKKMEMENGN